MHWCKPLIFVPSASFRHIFKIAFGTRLLYWRSFKSFESSLILQFCIPFLGGSRKRCSVKKMLLKIWDTSHSKERLQRRCFKNTYFEEHLGTTASERLRKISPLLVLGNAVLDGKRHNWATNAFYWKYGPHEVSLYYSRYFYPHGISCPENTPAKAH